MSASAYDTHAEFYVGLVDKGLVATRRHYDALLSLLVDCIGERLAHARVLDLCCGEGYAGRHMLTRGAREVVAIDLSSTLIEVARQRARGAASYRVDDAHELRSADDGEFDVVISQLALMDVSDHRKMFAAVRRALAPGGPFVFSMLHPCFKARPFHVSDAPELILTAEGEPFAVAVSRYATEGFFNSGGVGVRGRVGSYHRTLSTYQNDLLTSGFALERLEEPLDADAAPGSLFAQVPTVLIVCARAV